MSVEAGYTVAKQHYSSLKIRWVDWLHGLDVEGLFVNFYIKIILHVFK